MLNEVCRFVSFTTSKVRMMKQIWKWGIDSRRNYGHTGCAGEFNGGRMSGKNIG